MHSPVEEYTSYKLHAQGIRGRKPMSCKAIMEKILAQRLWQTTGKTPAATISAAIIREIASKGEKSRFRKVAPGKFTLAS